MTAGNDTIDGRGGSDTAIYFGAASEYDVTVINGVTTITPLRKYLLEQGVDTLVNVENIQFTGQFFNQAPFIWGNPSQPVARNSAQAISAFFLATDTQDEIVSVEVRELTAGGGYLALDGTVISVGQTVSITPADYSRLQYHAGNSAADADQIQIRASDGMAWSDWTTFTFTPINTAPLLTLSGAMSSNQPLPHGTTSLAASSMFSATDPDSDTITRYRIWDGTQGNGYFRVNGVAQPTNQVVDIAASQLSTVDFVPTGTSGTFDYVNFQAYDGRDWSGVATAQVQAVANILPVVNANSLTPVHGAGFVAASSMFSVSDGDSDTITQYEFRDNTTGHGYFRLGGVQQAATFQIAAGQLANVQFVPTATAGALDQIGVRAFDGFGWSAWKSFSVGAVPNAAPVASASGQALARGTTAPAASSLFLITDSDGDAMGRYRFFDGTAGNGRFALSGAPQAEGANIEITSAQLAGMQFVLGAAGTSDVVWVQAFDGFTWSNWTSFTVTAPQNAAPTAVVSDRTPSRGTTAIAAATLVTPTDPDGDTITHYKFFDGTAGSGFFRKNGIDQPELTNINVTAAELANTQFVLGGGSDVLWVQVYDGMSWGAWKTFTVNPPQNNAPVVTVANLTPGHVASIAGNALYTSITDADVGDTVTQYRFFDGTIGNGRFRLNGALQVENSNIQIAAANLANFDFQTSGTGSDVLWLQAYDGYGWSTWKSFTVAAASNNAPVATVNNLTPGRTVTSIAGSALQSVSDADGDAITQYRFFDGTIGNGRFRLNGSDQVEQQNITVNAADLASFSYRTSATGAGDTLWVQAYDGFAWGAWKSFTVAAPQNNAPVVTVGNRQASANAAIAASTLFAVSDADADPITKYQFWDSTPGGGAFRINGIAQAVNANIDVMASQLAATDFLSGAAAGTDQLWARASDGTSWGEWKTFNVTTLASS